MTVLDMASALILVLGAFFFFVGTVGLIRFRDVHSRLHALSKVDNLGLGLISISLALQADSFSVGAKILVIWLLALFASAVTCYAIAEWKIDYDGRG